MAEFPNQCQVVIIGGGIIGCSVAYHLSKLGWTDVTLIERKTLTCGTTWHSGACIGQLRPTYNMTRLAQYTGQLFNELELETGLATGYQENGALVVTADQHRFTELKRSASTARCFDLEVEVLTPPEAGELWPLLETKDLVGAVFLPTEGQTNATDTTLALAKGARQRGVGIFEQTEAFKVRETRGRVNGVLTNKGLIDCEYVVNCTGMWAREFGKKNQLNVPLHAVEHMYVVTEPIAEIGPNLPTLRDHNQCIYYRVDARQMLIGISEPNAKVWGINGIPKDFAFDQLPNDWEHFEPYMQNAVKRVPRLADAGIKLFLSGPESTTPDTRYLLGETPGLRGHFVAAGFSGVGVGSSGGAGKALAEWIVAGKPTMDLWAVDIRRMMPFQSSQRYLIDRVKESNGLLYAMHWPFRQHETARNIRISPIHHELQKAGACFGEVAGWERPNWYSATTQKPKYVYSYDKQNWFFESRREHLAVRTNVGFHDLTSESKFEISGAGAAHFLQRLCTKKFTKKDVVIRTAWLTKYGGIENSVSILKYSDECYLVLSAPEHAVSDREYLKGNVSIDDTVYITDVTSKYAQFALAGPNVNQFLQATLQTNTNPFNDNQLQKVHLGYSDADLFRVHDVGEPSYRILVTSEMASSVFQQLKTTGAQFSLCFVGQHAWDSLKIEKSVIERGTASPTKKESPISPTDTTKENAVSDGVGDSRPASSTLVSFLLHDPEKQLYGTEPVYYGGEIIGHIESAMYGHSVGGAIGLGYIQNTLTDFNDPTNFTIDIAGELYRATGSAQCFYDPSNHRDTPVSTPIS